MVILPDGPRWRLQTTRRRVKLCPRLELLNRPGDFYSRVVSHKSARTTYRFLTYAPRGLHRSGRVATHIATLPTRHLVNDLGQWIRWRRLARTRPPRIMEPGPRTSRDTLPRRTSRCTRRTDSAELIAGTHQ